VPFPTDAAQTWHDAPDHGAPWAFGAGNGEAGSGGHFEGGFEALIIRPYFESNPALTTRVFTNSTDFAFQNSNSAQTNFDYPYTVNPRVWLGYVMDCGVGLRVGWWHFEQASTSQTLSQPTALPAGTTLSTSTPSLYGNNGLGIGTEIGGTTGTPYTLAVTSDLTLDVWDLEATAVYHAGGCIVEGSAGIRYAHIAQSFGAFSAESNLTAAGTGQSGTLIASHNFNGAGPTLATEVRHALGDMGLGVYANARAAILFGDSYASGFDVVTTTTPGFATARTADTFRSDHLGVIGVGECEIGVEYSRKIGDSASAFVRAGIDGQIWLGAGSATSQNGALGFFGYTVTLGVNY